MSTVQMQGKLLTDRGLTVILNGSPYMVDKGHENYQLLLQNYHDGDWDAFLVNYEKFGPVKDFVSKDSLGNSTMLSYEDGKVFYCDREIHGCLVRRILELKESGLPIDDMVKFLENLMENPSNRSRDELYEFLEHENLPITEDGCFLAYKSVCEDFYSKSSGDLRLAQGETNECGQILNSVGQVVECYRNDVDDNRNNHCSHGLHVGALDYAGPGGWFNSGSDKVVIVKVNPKDVVSVPPDHSNQKVRVCCYEVISEYEVPLSSCHVNAVGTAGCCSEEELHDQAVKQLQDDYYVDPRDMVESECYMFEYHGNIRVATFVSFDGTRDNCLMLLTTEDFNYNPSLSNYRNFTMSSMSEIERY